MVLMMQLRKSGVPRHDGASISLFPVSHQQADWQCTLIMQDRGAIVTTETLEALANVMTEGPNTLTGTTFRLLIIYHQMAALIRHGRKQRLSSWNDEILIDTVTTAGHLEKLLEQEKERYQQLVNGESLSLCKFGCFTMQCRAWIQLAIPLVCSG